MRSLPVAVIVAGFIAFAAFSAGFTLWENGQSQDRFAVEQASAKRQEQAVQAEQRKAGLLVEDAICADLGTMAAIPPPPGNPALNPSRAYEDSEHKAWHGLYTGLRCPK